jgi:hypothetical protein
MTLDKTTTSFRSAPGSTPPVAIYAGLAALTVGALVFAGCGPEMSPPSLINDTRVVGARVEVEGAPERASPAPGETATVTWLVTAPAETPPLGWTFALCLPDAPGKLGCAAAPLGVWQGTSNPPRVTLAIPDEAALAGTSRLTLYGRICAGAAPTFDAGSGLPGCEGGAPGTTAALSIALQATSGDDPNANHNPVGDRGFTLDGAAWPPTTAGDQDPCADGPRLAAGSGDHAIATLAQGSERERYTQMRGDPPVPTPARESLQLSHFTTAGKLKVAYTFVEAADAAAETAVGITWTAPPADAIGADTPVTFTFVTRDSRGGAAWTTRTACLTP